MFSSVSGSGNDDFNEFKRNSKIELRKKESANLELPPLLKREWVPVAEKIDSKNSFTILSQNIMAQRYTNVGRHQYDFCPVKYILLEYRKRKVLQQYKHYNSDIICLQELSGNVFKDLKDNLKGYESVYKHVTKYRTWLKIKEKKDEEELNEILHGGNLKDDDDSDMEEGEGKGKESEKKEEEESMEKKEEEESMEKKEEEVESMKKDEEKVKDKEDEMESDYQRRLRMRKEGIGIFWKANRFKKLDEFEIEFNTEAYLDAEENIEDENQKIRFLRGVCLESHNISLVVILLDLKTNEKMIVTSIHGSFLKNVPPSQIWQIDVYFKRLHEIKEEKKVNKMIVCGDFNIRYKSIPYYFIINGSVESKDLQKESFLFRTLGRSPCHKLSLKQAYPESEKPITHFSCSRMHFDVLDYIFYCGFEVGKVLKLNKGARKEFPNKDIFSDHLMLGAEFQPKVVEKEKES